MARHSDERPHPLLNEATWRGIAGGIALGGGFLGIQQVQDLPALVEPVIGALAAGGVFLTTRSAAKAGEKHVTPTSSPRDDDGNPLVAISPEI